MTWTAEQRQQYAVNRDIERRRAEAMPVRVEIDRTISALGWRKARPVIEIVLGFPVPDRHGGWGSRVTVNRGQQLLEALHEAAISKEERAGQTRLF